MTHTGSVTLKQARRIITENQFSYTGSFKNDISGISGIIGKLGYLQIDTISVVERSHHHILWSRMPGYRHDLLDKAVENKLIFEYWSHAASYLPMRDFRFSLPRKRSYYSKNKSWRSANKKIIKLVLDRIKSEGPLRSKDFEDKSLNKSGWWNWKPSKEALDFLFHSGKLMIAGRTGFQKVYDLTERVLPDNADTRFPGKKEFYKHLISASVSSNGISGINDIMYLRKYDRPLFMKVLNELTEAGKLIPFKIQELGDNLYYSSFDIMENFSSVKMKNKIHILSPFDNVVINRKKLKEFFNFDYQLECYVPAHKRKFGYFSLPVLYKDRFIARIDAKASRIEDTFYVYNIYAEDNDLRSDRLYDKLKEKVEELALFSGCSNVKGI